MVGARGRLAARIGVRVASTFAAAFVIAVALVVTGAALVVLIGNVLDDRVGGAAAQAVADRLLLFVLVAVPVLIVVAGLAVYLLGGWSLRSVEALRAHAAAVADRGAGQPLPEPESQDEVTRLGETLNALVGRLEEARGAQRRIAASGPELRGPLTVLAGGLDQMQRGPVDRSTVAALRAETDRLARVIDALLAGTGGPAPPQRREEDGQLEQVTAPVPSGGSSGGMPAVHPAAAPPDPGDATTVITPLVRGPQDYRPVRDEDAREDPITAPRGIPMIRPGESSGPRRYPPQQGPPQTNPRGVPATDPHGASTDPRGSSPPGRAR